MYVGRLLAMIKYKITLSNCFMIIVDQSHSIIHLLENDKHIITK